MGFGLNNWHVTLLTHIIVIMSLRIINNYLKPRFITPIQSNLYFYPAKYIALTVSCFHYVLNTPFLIKYDDQSGQYHCLLGSWPYKILSILWNGFVTAYATWGFTGSDLFQDSNGKIIQVVYKFICLTYTFQHITWLILMWSKLRQLPSILNKGNDIYSDLVKAKPSILPENSFLRTCIHTPILRRLLVATFLIFTISTHMAYILKGTTSMSSPHQGLLIQFDAFVNTTVDSFCRIQNYWCLEKDSEGEPTLPAYFLGVFWLIVSSMASQTHQLSIVIFTFFALYFKQLFLLGMENIERSCKNREIFLATQTFTRITLLLDDFNGMFGRLLFATLLTSVSYQCASLAVLLGGRLSGVGGNFLMIVGVIPYYFMLFIMARVHKLGSTVPDLVKKKYVLQKGYYATGNDDVERDPISLEILHGAHMLNHDVLSNAIGFKGGDFFTISTSFVGNLIGVIATYTLVLIQLTNKK